MSSAVHADVLTFSSSLQQELFSAHPSTSSSHYAADPPTAGHASASSATAQAGDAGASSSAPAHHAPSGGLDAFLHHVRFAEHHIDVVHERVASLRVRLREHEMLSRNVEAYEASSELAW